MTPTTLTEQIAVARRQVVSDGYDMSVGELVSLYKNNELVINPAFQRLFRWEESQKTRFIESLLLGIPIPPVFVFQQESGVWELVDGLQRVSTILELFGELRDSDGKPVEPLELGGTTLLPALANKHWEPRSDEDEDALDVSQQLAVKRARLRVEILKKESDQDAKFELFQRLNTGGSPLSEQEVRNCVLVMVNKPFFDWLSALEAQQEFRDILPLTETQIERGKRLELALRFVSYRRSPYSPGLDLNDYLDAAARKLSKTDSGFWEDEESIFKGTFHLLRETLGSSAFKRWDGARHTGGFLISGFDAIAHGVASNLTRIQALEPEARTAFVKDRAKSIWNAPEFTRNSGMGVRGTTRLTNLLPFGVKHFAV
jgi:hypothetical protein